MIRVIRIDGQEILLNSNLISSVDPGERAVIHLSTGDKIQVKTSHKDVMEKIAAFRQGFIQALKEDSQKNESGAPEKPDKKRKHGPRRREFARD